MSDHITVKKARVHTLRSVSCAIPHNAFVCLTGVSGSGKSSFAFDTIYRESQRRYILALSHQAKRLVHDLQKPDVESIEGLTPTVAIEQKSTGSNPRSTVGTMTEIHEYLRLLYARVAIPHCPETKEPLIKQSKEEILRHAFTKAIHKKTILLSPFCKDKKGTLKEELFQIERKGFTKIRLDNALLRLDELPNIDKEVGHTIDIVIDRIQVEEATKTRFQESILLALEQGSGTVVLLFDDGEETPFSTEGYSKTAQRSYEKLEPFDFSFNSPSGMCPECQGLGEKQQFALDRIIDENKSIAEDCCSVATSYTTIRYRNIYDSLASLYNFSVKTPWMKLPSEAKRIFLYGGEKKWLRMLFVHPHTGATWYDNIMWKGVLHEAYTRYIEATSERFKQKMEQLMTLTVCPACHGGRLKPYPLAALFHGNSIHDFCCFTIKEALEFLDRIKEENPIAIEILKNIRTRLQFLQAVGLGYLTLNRPAPTLSGGEAQRVRLAAHLGSGLLGLTYILDEPSIGLHPVDNSALIQALHTLKAKGNTVMVVEHDEETIRSSDFIMDFGPKAGIHGGELLHAGTLSSLLKKKNSLTSDYLSGRKQITRPNHSSRSIKERLIIEGATLNTLKGDTLSLPLGHLIAITGVSGSGKSSLIMETLYPALSNALMKSELKEGPYTTLSGMNFIDKVISIDQTPIGRTPRSNAATYTKLFDDIRALFASLPESKAKGWKEGRFSFNVKEGSCPDCSGMGLVEIDMGFLETAYEECPACQGKRFDQETLAVRWKNKSIQDVLDMTFEEVATFFEEIPHIHKKASLLCRVGLSYLKLGQSSTTLSGGEAQRVKIAKELSRPDSGKTLYLLDEPTTGLHFHDMQSLINVLHELVEKGNTVVVIEHNMEFVKTADWIIDLGPGSGYDGGRIILQGPPEEFIKGDTPTARALKKTYESQLTPTKPLPPQPLPDRIRVVRATQNNLKNITVEIPRNSLTVLLGPSGAGKSSLALETLFAEGQRQFVESLSPYVRQFLHPCPKPNVESIENLSPTIALEKKHHMVNPRSTVGTMTETYEYLRILFAKIGIPHCPKTKEVIQNMNKERLTDFLLSSPDQSIEVVAPLDPLTPEQAKEKLHQLLSQGYTRIELNSKRHSLSEGLPEIPSKKKLLLRVIVDRLKTKEENRSRLLTSLQEASALANQSVIIVRDGEETTYFLKSLVTSSGDTYPEVTAQTFAFNTPEGMCPDCKGLGFQWGLDIEKLSLPKDTTALDLLTLLMGEESFAATPFAPFLESIGIHPNVPIHSLSLSQQALLFKGSSSVKEGETKQWLGIEGSIDIALKQKESFEEESLLRHALCQKTCPSCSGTRLHAFANHVTIDSLSISALAEMTISDAYDWFQTTIVSKTWPASFQIVIEEIEKRLKLLNEIGLGYLSLSRSAMTLSGGEGQRVRLISQIGSMLANVLYILEEPTSGLHPKDAQRMYEILLHLKHLGNTVLVIEHDKHILSHADWIVELGPEGGSKGGEILFQGTPKEFKTSKKSVTAPLLYQKQTTPKARVSKQGRFITIERATIHNLQNLSCSLPKGTMTTIIGPSGSGKSSLLFDVIAKAAREQAYCSSTESSIVTGLDEFSNFVILDQSLYTATARSDIASYVDLLSVLRFFYATLPEATRLGLEPKHFSPNHRSGMCTHCWGMGYKRVNMYFLAPLQIPCPECQGLRLNPLSLRVQYKNHSFGSLFSLSVQEAYPLFEHLRKAKKILESLIELGLGYVQLGHEIAKLSNGEFQRVKIAKEFAKQHSRKTLFLLDEPTSGLHIREVRSLIRVLNTLKEKGHTIIAVEHNEEYIRSSDWLIEMGPGAGPKGGKVIFEGEQDG